MPASVLALLKIVFLLGLYLFIARVVRVVWVEIFAERRSLAEEVAAGAGGDPRSERAEKADRADAARALPDSPPKAAYSRRERRALKKQAKQSMVLRIQEPPEAKGRTFAVLDEMTIGRAPGCAVPIDDTFASQIHARVFRRDGQVFVEDLGSTNGTFLNRKRVNGPVPVNARDRIQVGSTVIELQK